MAEGELSAMAEGGVKSEIMKIPNPSDSGQHYARIAPVERIRTGRTKEIQIYENTEMQIQNYTKIPNPSDSWPVLCTYCQRTSIPVSSWESLKRYILQTELKMWEDIENQICLVCSTIIALSRLVAQVNYY